ncbi:serine/threonine protein kinase KIN3 [Lachancea thermotolerans CBS 6340]|uniref:non-specific serine/threonine protein kinase n=1 Tax=Lachancea thermotolerans (strain ATCC 56472 / CBS 6340 / NRRL Y-8284) TaxID=559295 RepID=C5DIY3_LACTC|nr:KLTH0E16104p [Lachancea thermotolerans CBS 6340]CAR23744.1 KLTH0E16104p [Lachancea thermotolerans CBS 6340]
MYNRRPEFREYTGPRTGSYQVLEEIGRGSFGSVRKVIHLPTNKVLVRKEIKYGHMNSKERQQLISECAILSQLKHEHIVEFYEWDSDKDVLYFYMEYCSNGDLSQMISFFKKQRKYIPEKIVWSIMVQILIALYRCHYGADLAPLETIYDRTKPPVKGSNIVIHRDLKPGNIFLSTERVPDPLAAPQTLDYSKVSVKLGDFGLAKALGASVEFATTYVGTPYYMSPEVLMDQPYSPLSDIWSLGCVIYEMCTLRPPFQAKTYSELQRKIKAGNFDRIPEYYSDELQKLIESCIDPNLRTRASTYSLLQDPQLRVARKSLQLERFEDNLMDYEKELMNIGDILERQAGEYEAELAVIKYQYRKEFDAAVEQRVREVLNGKKVTGTPEIMAGRNHLHRPDYHWRVKGR